MRLERTVRSPARQSVQVPQDWRLFAGVQGKYPAVVGTQRPGVRDVRLLVIWIFRNVLGWLKPQAGYRGVTIRSCRHGSFHCLWSPRPQANSVKELVFRLLKPVAEAHRAFSNVKGARGWRPRRVPSECLSVCMSREADFELSAVTDAQCSVGWHESCGAASAPRRRRAFAQCTVCVRHCFTQPRQLVLAQRSWVLKFAELRNVEESWEALLTLLVNLLAGGRHVFLINCPRFASTPELPSADD